MAGGTAGVGRPEVIVHRPLVRRAHRLVCGCSSSSMSGRNNHLLFVRREQLFERSQAHFPHVGSTRGNTHAAAVAQTRVEKVAVAEAKKRQQRPQS